MDHFLFSVLPKIKNTNLKEMLIHDPFDFLNSKDLDTLPSDKKSHRLHNKMRVFKRMTG